jgi:hypothetical protein
MTLGAAGMEELKLRSICSGQRKGTGWYSSAILYRENKGRRQASVGLGL